MSSLTKSIQTARTEVVNGVTVEFARLDMTDLAAIAQEIIKERKIKAKEMVKESNYLFSDKQVGVGPFELYSILQEIEDKAPTVADIYVRAVTPAGAMMVLRQSLKKTGKTNAEMDGILANLDAVQSYTIAQELVTCNPVVNKSDFLKQEEQKKQEEEPKGFGDTPKKEPAEPAGFGDSQEKK